MALYEYKCKANGHVFTSTQHGLEQSNLCPRCKGPIRRLFSFSYKLSMPDGYNPSLGTYVSNEQQLKSEFSRMSDEATEYTGIVHNFQPIDYRDKEACGVTDEGLDATYDRAKAEGRPTLPSSTFE